LHIESSATGAVSAIARRTEIAVPTDSTT